VLRSSFLLTMMMMMSYMIENKKNGQKS